MSYCIVLRYIVLYSYNILYRIEPYFSILVMLCYDSSSNIQKPYFTLYTIGPWSRLGKIQQPVAVETCRTLVVKALVKTSR